MGKLHNPVRATHRFLAATAIALIGLTGCADFFPPLTTATTTTGSGNYLFALAPELGTLSAYTIGTSTLTLGTSSPVTLPVGLTSSSAGAVTVSRNNNYVYVGGLNYIYCYSIGSSGTLSLVTTSSVPVTANIVSMDTSPDGDYLFALDTLSQNIYQFNLNSSTGALTSVAAIPYKIVTGTTNSPKTIHAGATGSGIVVATLGTAGTAVFSYAASTGLGAETTYSPATLTESDNDAAIGTAGTYVYIVRSGANGSTAVNQVVALKTSSGVETATTTGYAPAAITLDSTGGYLYTANRGSTTTSPVTNPSINEFSVSTTTLTPLSTASFGPVTTVVSLARDSSGKYIFAGGIATSADLQMYTLSSGVLASASSIEVGNDTAGLQLATTH